MDLKYQYWHFNKELSDDVCNRIILEGKQKLSSEGHEAKVLGGDITGIRQSKVTWLWDQWYYDLLWPYMRTANENAGWNFDIEHSEDIQFTEYKKGGYYTWHSDGGSDTHSLYTKENCEWESYHGKVRKLSMTVNLSHEDDYDGGDFLIKMMTSRNGEEQILNIKEANARGSIIVFPSFYHHKISPITKGVRNSLVMWSLGESYK